MFQAARDLKPEGGAYRGWLLLVLQFGDELLRELDTVQRLWIDPSKPYPPYSHKATSVAKPRC